MKPALPIVIGIIIIAAIGLVAMKAKTGQRAGEAPKQSSQSAGTTATPTFSTPKKSPHFETASPTHGQTLAAAPINIVIDFNFDLHAKSTIKATSGGKQYSTGATTVDANKLTLRRAFDTSAPDGTYLVEYSACWPDGSCHDGHHEFAIDRSKAASFEDMTDRKAVTIKMSQIKFQPMEIKISKGTKVTWVNDEALEHFVNTETHPAHTYFTSQNSRGLTKGQSYSTMFDQSGIYPYHCSAHADQMAGTILVI